MKWGGDSNYHQVYISEKRSNDAQTETLAKTADIISRDIILTDIVPFYIADATVGFYYPTIEYRQFSHEQFPELDPDENYWLILSNKLDSDILASLDTQGYVAEEIVKDGVLGTYSVSVFRIKKTHGI